MKPGGSDWPAEDLGALQNWLDTIHAAHTARIALITARYPRILAVCAKTIASSRRLRSQVEAEDLGDQVVYRLMRTILWNRELTNAQQYVAYEKATISNAAKDLYRQVKRRREKNGAGGLSSEGAGALQFRALSTLSPQEREEQIEDWARTCERLALLPTLDRSIVERHVFEKISLKEIAEEMGLSYARVQKRWHRAKEKLKLWLSGADGTGDSL